VKKTKILILLFVCSLIYASGNETVELTSWLERRNQEPLLKPTWEFVITGTWTAADDSDTKITIPVNGVIIVVILEIPSSKTGAYAEVEIGDSAENIIFDSGDQAAGICTFNIFEPVTENIKVWMGPNAAFGIGGGEIVVTLRGI
jgi:hypothetical protein